MKYLLITGDAAVARHAVACGVDRIFVDLEVLGKAERQGHLDTVQSRHAIADLPKIRAAVPGTDLMVRINPLHAGSAAEIETCVAAGADLLMLPMFRSVSEAQHFIDLLDGRAKPVLLVETTEAFCRLPDLLPVLVGGEVYLGLNDLHLAMGLTFMFEILAGGLVDHFAKLCREAGVAFGFGGIARIGAGMLPGELVLAEHLRLGSTRVILSRGFHGQSLTLEDFTTRVDLRREIAALRDRELILAKRTDAEREEDRRLVGERVRSIVAQMGSR